MRSFPRNDFGTPTNTLHSSIVWVHLYDFVDPPFPTGTCNPSSVYLTSESVCGSSVVLLGDRSVSDVSRISLAAINGDWFAGMLDGLESDGRGGTDGWVEAVAPDNLC